MRILKNITAFLITVLAGKGYYLIILNKLRPEQNPAF